MYVKCGSVEDVWSVFKEMPSCDVVSWNATVGGHCAAIAIVMCRICNSFLDHKSSISTATWRRGRRLTRLGACCYASVCTHNGTILQYTILLPRVHRIETKAALTDQGSCKLFLTCMSVGSQIWWVLFVYVSLGSDETANHSSDVSHKHVWKLRRWAFKCSSGFLFALHRLHVIATVCHCFDMCWKFGIHQQRNAS